MSTLLLISDSTSFGNIVITKDIEPEKEKPIVVNEPDSCPITSDVDNSDEEDRDEDDPEPLGPITSDIEDQ